MSILPETPVPGNDALLTTGQAAALCRVDPRTIARWCDAGALPTHRTVGGRRRVQRADVEALMTRCGMAPSKPSDEPLRVAVVDDEPMVVRGIVRVLRRAVPHAELRSASNGFAAGVLLARFRPHVVLLDVVMPGLSGIDVCAQIRATPELAGMRVVIVSGHLTPAVRTELMAVGADAFVPKPFTVDALLEALTDARRGAARVWR